MRQLRRTTVGVLVMCVSVLASDPFLGKWSMDRDGSRFESSQKYGRPFPKTVVLSIKSIKPKSLVIKFHRVYPQGTRGVPSLVEDSSSVMISDGKRHSTQIEGGFTMVWCRINETTLQTSILKGGDTVMDGTWTVLQKRLVMDTKGVLVTNDQLDIMRPYYDVIVYDRR